MVMLDVLHYMDHDAQQALLKACAPGARSGWHCAAARGDITSELALALYVDGRLVGDDPARQAMAAVALPGACGMEVAARIDRLCRRSAADERGNAVCQCLLIATNPANDDGRCIAFNRSLRPPTANVARANG
jgi:hypothetical protein